LNCGDLDRGALNRGGLKPIARSGVWLGLKTQNRLDEHSGCWTLHALGIPLGYLLGIGRPPR
jgi:hypothetical protein